MQGLHVGNPFLHTVNQCIAVGMDANIRHANDKIVQRR